ncbi:MAG: RQC domain-containing protein, partial [Clostridia bacterium]|nr:RQC domain-containing protein [Clostridia bacterium]
MDSKLRYYAVMKTVELIHGKRGKTFLFKLLKGSREYSMEKAVREFDLIPLWGLLHRLEREEIEADLTGLIAKGLVFIKEVSSGSYTFPFLHISEEGRKELAKLEEMEGIQLQSYLEHVCFEQKNPEISKKGILLDQFLDQIFSLMNAWQNHPAEDISLDDLMALPGVKV